MNNETEVASPAGLYLPVVPPVASPPEMPSERLSLVTAVLEEGYACLRQRWPELPVVAMTVFHERRINARAGGVRGYFRDRSWTVRQKGRMAELHIDSTILSEPPGGILKTLLHEAAHGLASGRGIRDTSRDGRYHNLHFKRLAEEVGLVVQRDGHRGYAHTPHIHPARVAGYAVELDRLATIAGLMWQGCHALTPGAGGSGDGEDGTGNGEDTKPKSRMLKAVCSCPDRPRTIRLARATFEAAPIVCGACGHTFALV